ncbi:DNA-directed RNA polymerase II subunit 4 [Chlorella sorokiniana]|uniref:DNA-directed RNA polymerase II subunit 4 n=1 Tax=Chlorella sorokiniana TaxID=3076 RepID=A0A2P6TL07_CHLSO|nr:DNA-directed RNA polymerase II subunit 4 [Chlorella sorokiniana]|eukprot:PRW44955.1 DNA-directed RNA polymerase II subunit 4 [Chlorella sorokiniana]
MASSDQDDAFKNAKILTLGEAGVALEEVSKRITQRDPDWQPNAMMLKAVEYAQRFAANKNRDTLQKIRELLANRRLSEMELGLVASLAIETADEAKKLVPSLAAPTETREQLSDEELEAMLKELATYREFE